MKLQVAVLLTLCAVIMAENCRQTSDCKVTQCSDNSHHLACIRGECTCSTFGTGSSGGSACTAASECHCDHNRHPHCIDGHCRCTFII